MITMFDSVNLSQVPADAQAVAAYADGRFANVTEAHARFPHIPVLTIAVSAAHDADCLDIEQGDATPAQAAAWYLRQKARGIARPALYASVSMMTADVVPVIQAAGIDRASVRLWAAHYTHKAHICGPKSCRELSITADGTQWTDRALGRNLDQSLLADGFFGAPSWTETLVNQLPTLRQGDRDHPGSVQFVHRMQALIKVIGDVNKLPSASAVTPNGNFDAATSHGLAVIQKFFGLTADSVCGPKTWAALVAGQR